MSKRTHKIEGLAHLTPNQLRKVLDKVRIQVADAKAHGHDIFTMILGAILEDQGIPALVPCHGDAHSNPNIDNCGLCAPRWGWIEQPGKAPITLGHKV